MLTLARTVAVAAEKAKPVPHASEEALEKLRVRRANLREMEMKAAPRIEDQIAIGEVAQKYPTARILDPRVLRWRYDFRHLRTTIFRVPLPKLALLNIASPTFFLSRVDSGAQNSSILPANYANTYYGDILRQLNRATSFVKKSTLSFTWHGLIPPEHAAFLDEAENFFGHYKGHYANEVGDPRVYLLTEAPAEQWTIKNEEKEKVRYLDPLILGHRSRLLFVIGAFDPTPVEEYVQAEFTMKELTA